MSTKSADLTPEFTQDGTPPTVGRLERTRLRLHEAVCLGVIACLNIAFFAEVLFTERTFFARDVSTFHYPLKKLVTEAYARGEWPLWNPYIQMGQPLLANPNCMAVYPGQLLFQFLPFETAFELHFVVHCMLAGMGAFCLARILGLSLQAALLSAVIYNFSGLTLSAVNLFNILPVVAFLPWLTTALLWLVSRPSIARGCFTALLLGSFFLLLEPLSTLATALFVFVLVGAFVWQSGQVSSSWFRLLVMAVMVLLAAISIAAIQIVPTLELVQLSGRKGGLGFSEATFWSLHPVQLLQAVCPKILGEYFRIEAPVPWPARFFDRREPYLLSCYVGGMTLFLAAWGAWRSRCHWRTRSLVAAMAISILLALGLHTPLYSMVFEWVPIFRYGRFPSEVSVCGQPLSGVIGRNRMGKSTEFGRHISFSRSSTPGNCIVAGPVSCAGDALRRFCMETAGGCADGSWRISNGLARRSRCESAWTLSLPDYVTFICISACPWLFCYFGAGPLFASTCWALHCCWLCSWTCGAATFGSTHQATRGCTKQLRLHDTCRSERSQTVRSGSIDSSLRG